jgi:hypothetical protein
LKVSSFFDYTGPGRISIARYAPRGTPAGFRVYKPLAPGPWFNKVSKPEYERLYFGQLALLDPVKVSDDLHALADGVEPVLLCWERKADIFVLKKTWCHRHMVGTWLRQQLDIEMEEL